MIDNGISNSDSSELNELPKTLADFSGFDADARQSSRQIGFPPPTVRSENETGLKPAPTSTVDAEETYFDSQEIDNWAPNEVPESTANVLDSHWMQKLLAEAQTTHEITFTRLQDLIPTQASDDVLTQVIEHLEKHGINVVFPQAYWTDEKRALDEKFEILKRYIKDEGFSEYLCDISKYPTLSRNEERILLFLSKKGNVDARNRLAQSYLRYVLNMSLHYMNRGLPLMDLIQEGNIGLLKAIEGFDPQKSSRLYHYAHWWVRHVILRAIDNKRRVVRLPIYMEERIHALNVAKRQLETKLARKASQYELAEAIGMEVSEVERLLLLDEDHLTLKEADRDRSNRLECCELDGYFPIEEHAEQLLMQDRVMQLLRACLKKREQLVIIWRYGLDDEEPQTLEKIGKKLGLTRERIRQIENDAMEKLTNLGNLVLRGKSIK